MVALAKRLEPRRFLRVLGSPVIGVVRVSLVVGKRADDYVFARSGDAVTVRKAGGDEYRVGLMGGRPSGCGCKAAHYRGSCRHQDAAAKLIDMGVL